MFTPFSTRSLGAAALALSGVAVAAGLSHAAGPEALPANGGKAVAVRQVSPATGPTWTELSSGQRAALKPLSGTWHTMSEGHKRKWIAVSANYASLGSDEQLRLHERMTEWAALSPQQRAQARFNFAQTKQLSAEEKKAKWEAYQALSAEERQKLASKAPAKPPGVTLTVKPIAPQKLASVPAPKGDVKHPPKIVAGSNQRTDSAPAEEPSASQ